MMFLARPIFAVFCPAKPPAASSGAKGLKRWSLLVHLGLKWGIAPKRPSNTRKACDQQALDFGVTLIVSMSRQPFAPRGPLLLKCPWICCGSLLVDGSCSLSISYRSYWVKGKRSRSCRPSRWVATRVTFHIWDNHIEKLDLPSTGMLANKLVGWSSK